MLASGTHVGPYQILSPLDRGGMGELYKAHDSRLHRVVAIKFLQDEFAGRSDVRERLIREARAIAKLSHPNICVLYDVGTHADADYLVMEYLEGESLEHRLQRGAIPLEQVIAFGRQIAAALDCAHRHGIIHRDIKPANVMLTRAGAKVLDFGLAKLRRELTEPHGRTSVLPAAPGSLTSEGTILGTLNYMAPEQVEGKVGQLGARSDIFSFGAVLYEMVTGKRAFPGDNAASVISAIMRDQPPSMTMIRGRMPAALERLVNKCLAKDPEDRWQSAQALAEALEWIETEAERSGEGELAGRGRTSWFYAGSAIALVAAVIAALWVGGTRKPAMRQRVQFDIPQPYSNVPNQLALSPDGTRLAAIVGGSEGDRLWVYSFGSGEARELARADTYPFWSPDGSSIGFFVRGRLSRVDLVGGGVRPICEAANGAGATWNRDGVIVFARGGANGLFRVAAAGGTPAKATSLDTTLHETDHIFPQFLPDNDHFIYLAVSRDPGRTMIRVGGLRDRKTRDLQRSETQAAFSPPDQLVYLQGSTLMARRMDLNALKLTGEPRVIATDVGFNLATGTAAFTTTGANMLVFRHGAYNRRLVWFDRTGAEKGAVDEPGRYEAVSLSPDGVRIAYTKTDTSSGNADVWVFNTARGQSLRITSTPELEANPIWSPDGSELVFGAGTGDAEGLYRVSSSGTGTRTRIPNSRALMIPTDWSSDGKRLAVTYLGHDPQGDLYELALEGGTDPAPMLATAFSESGARWAPNGQAVAYVTDETGRFEVYVERLGAGGQKLQVSTTGGGRPRWRGDGRELYYLNPALDLMAVAIRYEPTFEIAVPRVLFRARVYPGTRQYVPDASGDRFLMIVSPQASIPPPTAILNWATDAR